MRFLIFLGVFILSMSSVLALSCAPTEPKIGIIDSILEEESRVVLSLRDVYTYDYRNIARGGTYSLSAYQQIVQKYIRDGYTLEKAVLVDVSPSSISIEKEVFSHLSVKPGEIVIQGPPFHVCTYSLYAFFDQDRLLRVYTKNNFADLSYKGEIIKTSPGEPMQICKGQYCDIEVNFDVAGKKFIARPNKIYLQNSSSIYSLVLINAKFHNPNSKFVVEDWGINKYARYVLYFHGGIAPSLPEEPVEKPVPVEKEVPAPMPTPEPKMGPIKRFIAWFFNFW